MSDTEISYVEPISYFPKEIRKKYGLGEYDKSEDKTDSEAGKNKPEEEKK